MNTTYRGTIAIVKPEGMLHDIGDDTELNALSDVLNELVEHGTTRIIVNLSKVDHMNSTAVGPLIVAHGELAHKEGGHFALTDLSEIIKHLLVITKLESVFEVFDTDDDAIRAFEDT